MSNVGSGKYTYSVIEDWATLPAGESFAMVSAVATDSQDQVYAFQRQDPPVLIFDRDGNYRSNSHILWTSWLLKRQGGFFGFAH